MSEASAVAKKASSVIEKWLRQRKDTSDVRNVEDEPEYREKDIDLLWFRVVDEKVVRYTVEIKGDRYYRTNNYFLETYSNFEKGTPGCFMYSEAYFLFYYFVDEQELHIMKMSEAREWFKENIELFEERKTSTPVGNGDRYHTVGRLVNRDLMRKYVKITIFKI